MKPEDIENMATGRQMDALVAEKQQDKPKNLTELFHSRLTNRGKQTLAQQAIEDLEAEENDIQPLIDVAVRFLNAVPPPLAILPPDAPRNPGIEISEPIYYQDTQENQNISPEPAVCSRCGRYNCQENEK
jgi:hypothetical protein